VVPFVLRSEIWYGGDARRRWYLRALVGTLAMSLAICFLSGMSNVRYAYVIVPPLALVAGALADRVARGEIGAELRLALWRGVWVSLTLMFVAAVYMGIASHRGADRADILQVICGGVIALAGWLMVMRRMRGSAWPGRGGVVVLMIGLGLNMAMLSNHRRVARSTAGESQILTDHVKSGEVIMTGLTALDQPELFYYAHVDAFTYGNLMLTPFVLPRDGWVVLKGAEFTAWTSEKPACVSNIIPVVPQRGNDQDAIYLAWYTRPSLGAATTRGSQ
jgi:hypothetical protein